MKDIFIHDNGPKMKKFRLLKDVLTPGYCIPEGQVFVSGKSEEAAYTSPGCNVVFSPSDVINNPTWFEEIKEEEKKFTKNDLLLLIDFCLSYKHRNDASLGEIRAKWLEIHNRRC